MGIVIRAFRSIWMRRGKNFIIFLTCLIVTVLLLASLEVRKGIEEKIENINESIKVTVTLRKEGTDKPYGYNKEDLYPMKCAREIARLPFVEKSKYVVVGNAKGVNVDGLTSSFEERFSVEDEDYYEGDEALKNAGPLTVIGVKKLDDAWTVDIMGDTLTSGIDEMENNNAVVSENFLSENHLKLQDEIELAANEDSNAKVILKIVGTHSGNYENAYACYSEENYIYTSLEMAQIISGNQVMETEYELKSPQMMDEFIVEAEKILSSYTIKGDFIKNEMEYVLALSPIWSMEKMGNGMWLATVIMGFLILCILECLILSERTLEIGILRAIGSSRLEIIVQLLIEMQVIVFISTVIGIVICTVLVFVLGEWLEVVVYNLKMVFTFRGCMIQLVGNLLMATLVLIVSYIIMLKHEVCN